MHVIEYKGFQIKAHPQLPTSYIVVTAGRGGKIPDVMTGMFTSPALIKNLIDTYLAGKPTKDNNDDKNSDKGRG